MRRLRLLLCLVAVTIVSAAVAQAPVKEWVAVGTVDRPDGMYKCGEEATFTVAIKHNGELMTAGDFDWTLSNDGIGSIASGKAQLGEQPTAIKGTLTQPGVLRLTISAIDGKRVWLTPVGAGYEVEKIVPLTPEPADFAQYWEEQKAALRAIPADVQMEKMDKYSSDQQTTYKISFANINGTRQYGWLSVPTKEGKYPGWLGVPAAGYAPNSPANGMAANGFVTMVLYAHNYPVDLPAERYNELQKTELAGYPTRGRESRDTYYFRRVFLGCTRFMDYLMSRPEWDGKNLFVQGSSQGGGLSLISAGLEPKVTGISSNVPALCDHTAIMKGRIQGWPSLVSDRNEAIARDVAPYFDAVNFARHAKCASVVSCGFADTTCAPSSVYAAFSVLPQPKLMVPTPTMGHAQSPEFSKISSEFIKNMGKLPE
ncbi:MAG: acetylxylan esterase [Armatimonadota bacterium]